MEQKPVLGSFLLEAARSGNKAVTNLTNFGTSTNFTELSAGIALCSTLLTEVAKTISCNEPYFTVSFEQRFMKIIQLCKEKFDDVNAGLNKAREWKPEIEDSNDDVTEDHLRIPKILGPWKRLVWGMDRDIDNFFDLGDMNMKEAITMLHYAASLVIIQKHAQIRELTPTEKTELQRLKKKTGWFLDNLRRAEIGTVMAFGLREAERKETNNPFVDAPRKSPVTVDSESATLCGTSVAEIPQKKPESTPSVGPPPSSPPRAAAVPPIPISPIATYEMWRISEGGRILKTNSKHIRILGIPLPFKFATSETVDAVISTKTPLSKEELTKLLSEKEVKTTDNTPSILDMLSELSESVYSITCQLVNDHNKNERGGYKWSLKGIAPVPEPKHQQGWWRRRGARRTSSRISHATWIVILERVDTWPRPPPPPPGWKPSPRRIIVEAVKEEKKVVSGTQVQLTQQETENVVNDFLASVSTLYEDVPVEDRAAVLQSVKLLSDLEYDSDDDSSSGSGSSSGYLESFFCNLF